MNLKKLKTFEDACKVEGLDPKKVIPDFSCYPEQDRKAMVAHAKLVIVVRAANRLANGGKEWKADFSDHSQWKYEAWFYKEEKKSGKKKVGPSGFRFGDCDHWCSFSSVGSRLCSISRAACEYVAKQFIDLYRDYFV
jgi:hypothetical protein